jgi:hypothetical protein
MLWVFYYVFKTYESEMIGIADDEYSSSLRGLPVPKDIVNNICKIRLKELADEATKGLF